MSKYDAVLEVLSKNPGRFFLVYGADKRPYFYIPKGIKHFDIPEGWEHNEQKAYLRKTIQENGFSMEYEIGIVHNMYDIS